MIYNDINFNDKTILITGGAGFIGSNIAFHIQKNFPSSKIVIFDCFRKDDSLANGKLKSLGNYKNLIGFNGDIICGNIQNYHDLSLLNKFNS